MARNKEQDELIEFLLDQNWRLTKRITAVSAKSNRKSRHIKNLLKGVGRLKNEILDSQVVFLKALGENDLRSDLERAELRISELSGENSRFIKDNAALRDRQDFLNAAILGLEQQIRRLTSIETTKDKDLEKKLSNDDLLVLAGATGCGMVLGIVGVICLALLS